MKSPLPLCLASLLSFLLASGIPPAAAALPTPVWVENFEATTSFYPGMDAAQDPSGRLVMLHKNSVLAVVPGVITPAWSQYVPLTPLALTVDAAGNAFVTGSSATLLTKLSPSGQLLWTQTGSAGEYCTAIVTDDQGGVYVAGYQAAELLLVKFNSDGVQQWVRRFNGAGTGNDKATGLVAMPGGGVVVTGLTHNSDPQFITIRYSATGSAQWIAYYDEPGVAEGAPIGVVRTEDSGIVISGDSGPNTLATVKYSAAGAQLWANRTSLSANAGAIEASARDLQSAPGGGAAVLGRAYVPATFQSEYTLHAIAANGVTSWKNIFRTIPSSYAGEGALTALPGGGWLAAAGNSDYNSSHTGTHAWLTPFDASGAAQTAVEWPPPQPTGPIVCRTVVTGGNGSVWAVAESRSFGLQVKHFGTLPVPGAPAAVTSGFDSLLSSSVRLKGMVNPNSAATAYHFQYGPTITYGSSTAVRSLPAGNSLVEAFEPGVTVTPGATYHFRIVATNSLGTSEGADQAFTVPQSAYQQWAAAQFGSIAAPGSGPADDPDFDGLLNLVEFTFAGSPFTGAMPAGLPRLEMWESPDSGIIFPSIVYHPDAAATGITITPVASNNLTVWSTSGIVVINQPDGSRRAVAQGLQHFMRLEISAP